MNFMFVQRKKAWLQRVSLYTDVSPAGLGAISTVVGVDESYDAEDR